MFNFQIEFYKLHEIDKDTMRKAFDKGEIKYNTKQLHEYFKRYNNHLKTTEEIKYKVRDELTAGDIYFEALLIDEKKLLEEYNFLTFSYQNRNLISVRTSFGHWNNYYYAHERLQKYLLEMTNKSYHYI